MCSLKKTRWASCYRGCSKTHVALIEHRGGLLTLDYNLGQSFVEEFEVWVKSVFS